MIIAITNFQLPKPVTRDEARSIFLTHRADLSGRQRPGSQELRGRG